MKGREDTGTSAFTVIGCDGRKAQNPQVACVRAGLIRGERGG